jgi:phosphoserine phosphatase
MKSEVFTKLTITMLTLRLAQAFSSKSTPSVARYSMRCMMSTVSPNSLLQSVGGSEAVVGNQVADAMYSLYKADAVCFDVDSTVISEEGIDVLADSLGKGAAVAKLTKQAMEGDTKFQDALKMRLALMQPSKSQIETCLKEQPLFGWFRGAFEL